MELHKSFDSKQTIMEDDAMNNSEMHKMTSKSRFKGVLAYFGHQALQFLNDSTKVTSRRSPCV